MKICTFLGHMRVYDSNIYQKLIETIQGIVKTDDEIEFWFSSTYGTFYEICLAAAYHTKQCYPQKKITTTVVVTLPNRAEVITKLKQGSIKFPPYFVDRVVSLPSVPDQKNERNFSLAYKKIERWLLRRSSYLITYLYPAFCEPEMRHILYAKNRGVQIVDITNQATTDAIMESLNLLPEKEQFIVQKLLEGESFVGIGRHFGITGNAINQKAHLAAKSLRGYADARLRQEYKEGTSNPLNCSIFSMGPAIYNSVISFKRDVSFLLNKFHVRRFYIASEYAHSEYMNILRRYSETFRYSDIEIVVVTHYPEMAAAEWEGIEAKLSPVCHRIENIEPQGKTIRSQIWQATKAMIEQSDFCICDLSTSYLSKSIIRYAQKRKKAIWDISKEFSGNEENMIIAE